MLPSEIRSSNDTPRPEKLRAMITTKRRLARTIAVADSVSPESTRTAQVAFLHRITKRRPHQIVQAVGAERRACEFWFNGPLRYV